MYKLYTFRPGQLLYLVLYLSLRVALRIMMFSNNFVLYIKTFKSLNCFLV